MIGHGLNADPGQAHGATGVVPKPHVDRLAHVGVVRLLREDELTLVAQPARQIHGHWSFPPRAAGAPRRFVLPAQPPTDFTQDWATAAGCSCLAVTSRFNLEMASVVSLASIWFNTLATPGRVHGFADDQHDVVRALEVLVVGQGDEVVRHHVAVAENSSTT